MSKQCLVPSRSFFVGLVNAALLGGIAWGIVLLFILWVHILAAAGREGLLQPVFSIWPFRKSGYWAVANRLLNSSRVNPRAPGLFDRFGHHFRENRADRERRR